MITLRPPTLDECQQARIWRNDPAVLPSLRTGAKTEAEQAAFYREVVTNPSSNHRYYAVVADGGFIGLGGLTYLGRTAGEAEISLLIDPAYWRHGFGAAAVDALLTEAFGPLGLSAVIGECYAHSYALGFWQRVVMVTQARDTMPLPVRIEYQTAADGAFTFRWVRQQVAA